MPHKPYITVTDRDRLALRLAARVLGTSTADLGWSFMELCEWLWLEDARTVTAAELSGFFCSNPRTVETLVAFGVLERDGDRYRIPGRPRVELQRVELDGEGRAPPFLAGEC